jgi:hypothetical protein
VEVAGSGVYYLNRRAFIAYIVDTTNITIIHPMIDSSFRNQASSTSAMTLCRTDRSLLA